MRRKMPNMGLLLSLLAVVACGMPEPPTPENAPAPTQPGVAVEQSRIQTMLVTANPAMPMLSLAGRVAYAEDRFSKISSPLQGRVVEVRAKLGQHVKAGSVLLVVDTPDIATAYSDYVKEISELSLAKRNYELALDLYQVHAMPLRDLKQAENDYTREKAEFRQAKEKLLTLRVPLAELEKPLEQQNIMSRFDLKSPLTGTVVERNVTPGQLVGGDPSQVLFTVADLNALQVVADLYERDLGLVSVGQVAAATVESAPGVSFPAAVAAVGEIVDSATRTIKVRAWVNNEGHLLKPDMFARLNIPVGGDAPLIAVPNEAVVEADGRMFAYIEDKPAHYVKREVKVEKLGDKRMRVVEGLAAGERVVSKGAILMKAMQNGS